MQVLIEGKKQNSESELGILLYIFALFHTNIGSCTTGLLPLD